MGYFLFRFRQLIYCMIACTFHFLYEQANSTTAQIIGVGVIDFIRVHNVEFKRSGKKTSHQPVITSLTHVGTATWLKNFPLLSTDRCDESINLQACDDNSMECEPHPSISIFMINRFNCETKVRLRSAAIAVSQPRLNLQFTEKDSSTFQSIK